MNIVEAFIKFNGKLVIFVSGLSGCGKTKMARNISSNLNLHLIDQFKYFKKNYQNDVRLPNGDTITNYNTDDAINWDKFNDHIKKYASSGVIVSGSSLVDEKITIKPDIHLHISINKKNCMEKRRLFMEKNKKKFPKKYEKFNDPIQKVIMNQYVYPYYLDTIKRSTINKFLNANKLTDDQLWDNAWDTIIEFIQNGAKKMYNAWRKKNPDEVLSSSEKLSESELIVNPTEDDNVETINDYLDDNTDDIDDTDDNTNINTDNTDNKEVNDSKSGVGFYDESNDESENKSNDKSNDESDTKSNEDSNDEPNKDSDNEDSNEDSNNESSNESSEDSNNESDNESELTSNDDYEISSSD